MDNIDITNVTPEHLEELMSEVEYVLDNKNTIACCVITTVDGNVFHGVATSVIYNEVSDTLREEAYQNAIDELVLFEEYHAAKMRNMKVNEKPNDEHTSLWQGVLRRFKRIY